MYHHKYRKKSYFARKFRLAADWNCLTILTILLVCVLFASFAVPCRAGENKGGYAGLEFLGASLISRIELDKLFHLHAGSSIETTSKAVERVQQALEQKLVKTNIAIVPAGNNFFVAVDVIETGLAAPANRLLQDPHHIGLPNEKPFAILEELKTRLQKLADEGRPAAESYQEGFRVYSDFACTRIAERMAHELDGQKPYLFQVLASDPNNERRAAVAEMLNWTVDPVQNCQALIPALDDSDMHVRMAASKYIWARINLLSDNFPFDSLLEALTRQLSRPSHHDRIRAMSALMALGKRDSDSITGIKTFDEARLKEIAANSIIPSVQELARQILTVCASPPPLRRSEKQAPLTNSF